MLSRMRLTLSTKNWQNVKTSCAHWASSYTTLCLLCNSFCAVRQVARNIAGRFVEFWLDVICS